MIDIIVDTVNTCPMSCKYCGTRSNEYIKEELSKEIIENILLMAKKENNTRVFLGGGLFFCHSHWQKILEANSHIKANITIDSPLSYLSIKSIQLFSPEEYFYKLSISFWGIGETHDKLSGVKSFYMSEKLIKMMVLLQKELLISFVISKELINQHAELICFLNTLPEQSKIYFHRLMPVGKALSTDLPTKEEILRFVDTVKLKCNKNMTFHHTVESNECVAGKNRVFINFNGDVFGCGWVKNNIVPAANLTESANCNLENLLLLTRKKWKTTDCPISETDNRTMVFS